MMKLLRNVVVLHTSTNYSTEMVRNSWKRITLFIATGSCFFSQIILTMRIYIFVNFVIFPYILRHLLLFPPLLYVIAKPIKVRIRITWKLRSGERIGMCFIVQFLCVRNVYRWTNGVFCYDLFFWSVFGDMH